MDVIGSNFSSGAFCLLILALLFQHVPGECFLAFVSVISNISFLQFIPQDMTQFLHYNKSPSN